jgi:hypothetical protein
MRVRTQPRLQQEQADAAGLELMGQTVQCRVEPPPF